MSSLSAKLFISILFQTSNSGAENSWQVPKMNLRQSLQIHLLWCSFIYLEPLWVLYLVSQSSLKEDKSPHGWFISAKLSYPWWVRKLGYRQCPALTLCFVCRRICSIFLLTMKVLLFDNFAKSVSENQTNHQFVFGVWVIAHRCHCKKNFCGNYMYFLLNLFVSWNFKYWLKHMFIMFS